MKTKRGGWMVFVPRGSPMFGYSGGETREQMSILDFTMTDTLYENLS